jgi:thiol-disulfide isomerase/thioredoxin
MITKKAFYTILFFFSLHVATGQSHFETIKESSGTIILKGLIDKQVLDNEPSFTWMKQNQDGYKPDTNCVSALKNQRDSIYLLVFAGTWCGDTQFILPRFFKLLQESGFPLSRVNIIGVDRSKKTTGTLAESMGVYNVPTFIVMKNGKETGRVVEYGKYGIYDRELGEIISGRNK